METRNCKGCGVLFNFIGGPPLCQKCQKEIEDKFEGVKAYVYDHPKAGLQEVADENGVTVNQLKRWVKEERLMFAEGSAVTVECEKCGKPILMGKYCPQCKDKMTNNLNNLYRPAAAAAPKAAPKTEKGLKFIGND